MLAPCALHAQTESAIHTLHLLAIHRLFLAQLINAGTDSRFELSADRERSAGLKRGMAVDAT